ncbi:MAG: hypothetical protein HUJ60_05625, partial [Bacilli bacterium]|nr:hypothetical protein [Bacilli bacterium]
MEEEKKIIEAEETKVEEPIIEKEATPVVENEPMDEDFADAAPKVEPKKEEEIKPEPEPEPEPDLPPLFPELSSYEYNDERLAKIEEARVTYHKTAKKRGLIHTILIIGTLVLMIAGYLIPFLAIPDEETKMRVALICALAGAVIGLVTSAVYGFIQRKKDK